MQAKDGRMMTLCYEGRGCFSFFRQNYTPSPRGWPEEDLETRLSQEATNRQRSGPQRRFPFRFEPKACLSLVTQFRSSQFGRGLANSEQSRVY